MGKYIMPKILFAVDEHNHPKVLKIELLDAEHFDIIKDFIKKYPQHEGIGRLLASLEGKASPS